MIIKGILTLLWLGLLPAVVGCLWTRKIEKYNGNLLMSYFFGLFSLLALFEVLAVPMIFLKCSLTLLVRTWAGCGLALALISVIVNRSFLIQRRWLGSLWKKMTLVLAASLVCMGLQMAYVTERQHIDDDDAFYLATSTTAVDTDSLFRYNAYTGKVYKRVPARYVMAAWPLFIATVSQLTTFHPAVLAHTVLPGIIVLWSYLIYMLFGVRLFPGDKRKQSLFLLFIVVLQSFSGYSIYSSSTFLFIRSWQGKAVLAGVGIPAILYGGWMALKERAGKITWLMLGCTVTAACMFSSMGVVLSAILLGCFGLVGALAWKKWYYLPGCGLAGLPAIICGAVYFS